MKRPAVRIGLALAAAALVLTAAPRATRGAPLGDESIAGRWLLDFRSGGSVELTLKRAPASGSDHWSSSDDFGIADFQGLRRPASSSDAPASFRMERDGGTISFEGQLRDAGGAGRFTFQPNAEYLAALAHMDYATPTAEETFSLAVCDVSRAFIRERAGLGYERVALDDLVAMRIHGASPQFIRDLEALGYDHLSVDDLVAMRIHGASPDFIRSMQTLGYRSISADDLVSMRIHSVTPDFVSDIQALGYRNVSADDLVSMRIHGVSVEYVKKMKSRNQDVSLDEIVNMKIHGRG